MNTENHKIFSLSKINLLVYLAFYREKIDLNMNKTKT
jgi:hypothetical protein